MPDQVAYIDTEGTLYPVAYYRRDNNADVICVGTFRPERIVAIADRFGVGEYHAAVKVADAS